MKIMTRLLLALSIITAIAAPSYAQNPRQLARSALPGDSSLLISSDTTATPGMFTTRAISYAAFRAALLGDTLGTLRAQRWAAGNGAGATPSYTFASDLNTGIYRVGADTLGFSAGSGSTPRMRLSSTGLMPGSDDVYDLGTDAHRWSQIKLGAGTDVAPSVQMGPANTGFYAKDATSDTVFTILAGNPMLRVTHTGGVGAVWMGGQAASLSIIAGTGNSRTITLQTTTSAGTAKNTLVLGADSTVTTLGTLVVPDTIRFGDAHSFIRGGAGNMTILAGTGANRDLIVQTTDAGGVVRQTALFEGDQVVLAPGATNAFLANASRTEVLTNGNLALRSSADSTTLYSFGTAIATLTAAGADTIRTAAKLRATALTAASGTPNTVCINATTKELTENAATNCTVSSIRFKSNVAPLSYDEANRIVFGIKPVSFTYKEGGRRAIGYIAEQADSVDARLATRTSGGQINSVNYEQVAVALHRIVLSQQAQISDLTKRLAALEAKAAKP